jgi:hypothetical protein
MIAIVWRYLGFSMQPLWLRQEELRASLSHHDRRAQHLPEVESKAASAIRMMAIVAAPGKYVGLGHKVIKERRGRPRIRQY